MRTLLTLVVEDAKVLPILRAIEHIGAEQLDIKPMREKAKALPAPAEDRPPHGSIRREIMAAIATGPKTAKELKQLLPHLTDKQVWGATATLSKMKKIKMTEKGWRLNGS